MKYIIQDTEGNSIAFFNNFNDAINAKAILYQRPDWRIVRRSTNDFRQSTPRQRAAVSFCESLNYPDFMGDRNNFYEVSAYLSMYLESAKHLYDEISCEYEAYIESLDQFLFILDIIIIQLWSVKIVVGVFKKKNL